MLGVLMEMVVLPLELASCNFSTNQLMMFDVPVLTLVVAQTTQEIRSYRRDWNKNCWRREKKFLKKKIMSVDLSGGVAGGANPQQHLLRT